jgi:hypothetical protein
MNSFIETSTDLIRTETDLADLCAAASKFVKDLPDSGTRGSVGKELLVISDLAKKTADHNGGGWFRRRSMGRRTS